ncbi:type II secretion system major pseudopilin GspG [Halothermothrix orenii]|uniref:Type II secretion system core protein G n=1 Tax=Halothermothrix orenii (strain H 168 / OCM 544 / DSM 9562) TaxID=373903 RepID=B8CZ98_HALOH|nr:type II secretion system major pseudopilin GspG [Halothermothrix orenii]ACL70617.1 type II secretion system protein G [Halothermothrix orenii H 168]
MLLRNEGGFSLIEILIAVVIIGFLAATIGPELMNKVTDAKQTAARNQLEILEVALDNYRLDNGRYPTTQQGLKALIEKPTISPIPQNWDGPYLEKKEIPLDPWGNEYNYLSPGNYNTHKYDLWSYGLDNKKGGTGEASDVTNW